MKKVKLLGGHGVAFWNPLGAIGRPVGPIGQPFGVILTLWALVEPVWALSLDHFLNPCSIKARLPFP